MARRIISFLIIFCFCFEQAGFAQSAVQFDSSPFVARLRAADADGPFRPVHLRYVSYDAAKEGLNFLLDRDTTTEIKPDAARESCGHLLEYFLTGLSLPGNFFWVNLRPDSPGKMIDSLLAKTAAGKILLEADLQLKKDTAAYTSPGTVEGREYWNKLYKKAEELFGSSDVSIPTLTRPWIVPDEIIIRESANSAYIYKATLKVMLEQDYLKDSTAYNFQDQRLKQLNEYASQLISESIIPRIRYEVNSSRRYAKLRQVYYSLILAQWFKGRFRNGHGKYEGRIDTIDLTGIRVDTVNTDAYFQAYKKSFNEGEYNLRETVSTGKGRKLRTYFSGGLLLDLANEPMTVVRALSGRDEAAVFGKITPYFQAGIVGDRITVEPGADSFAGDVQAHDGGAIDSQRRNVLRRLENNEGLEDFSLLVGEMEDEGFRNEILEFLSSENDDAAMYYKAKFVKNLLEKLNGDKVIFDFLCALAAEAPPEQRLRYFSNFGRFIYSGTIADIDDLQLLPEYIRAAGFLDDRDALRIFRFLSDGKPLESEELRGYPLRGFPFHLKGDGPDDAERFTAAIREMVNNVFDSGTIAGDCAANPLAASIIASALGFNNDWGHKGITGTFAEFMRRMNEASDQGRISLIDPRWSAIGRRSISVRTREAEQARRNMEQAGAEIYRFRQILEKAAVLARANRGDPGKTAVREARAILEGEISRLDAKVLEHKQHAAELERWNPEAVRAEALEILDRRIQAAGKNRKLLQEGMENEKARIVDELNTEKRLIAQGALSLAFGAIERNVAQVIDNAEKRVDEYRAFADSLEDHNVSLPSLAEYLLSKKAVFYKLLPVLLAAEVFNRYPEKKKILSQEDAGGFLQGLVEIRDVLRADVLKDHPAQAKLMKIFDLVRLASIADQIDRVSQETAVLSVFATKDKFVGELASDIADVCYSYVPEVMAKPVTAVIFSVEEEGIRQGAGSMLLLENTVKGKKTLILRALNPSEEYLAGHSASDFVLAAFAYAKLLADARGFEKIAVPFDVKNAMSNRRIRDEIEHYIASQSLILDSEETFNGFNITRDCREVLRSEIIERAAARMSSGAGNSAGKKTDGGGIVNSTKKGNNGWILLLNSSGHEIGQLRVLDDLPLDAGIGRIVGIKLGGEGETEEYITAHAGRIIEDAIRLGIHPVTALANQRFVEHVLAAETEVNEQRLSETVVMLLDDRGPRAFAYMDSGIARVRWIPANENVLVWTPQIKKGHVRVSDIFDRNLIRNQRVFSFAMKQLSILYREMKSRPVTLDDYDVTAKDGGRREIRGAQAILALDEQAARRLLGEDLIRDLQRKELLSEIYRKSLRLNTPVAEDPSLALKVVKNINPQTGNPSVTVFGALEEENDLFSFKFLLFNQGGAYDEASIELNEIFVHSAIRNQSFGTRIILRCLEYFLQAGFKTVWITPEGDGVEYWRKFGMSMDARNIPIEVLIDRMRKRPGNERGAVNGQEPAASQNKMGGIDFSSLPITRQRLSMVSAGAGLSSAALAMNLEQEWRGIKKMIKGGVIPSAGRIGEFIAVCKAKGEMETYSDDVLAGIAGILRLEEAGPATPTEAGFKEILFFLEEDTVGAS